jgi:hypothetical protein
MPLTVMDVANQAGISSSKIARALNNGPAIARETLERTLKRDRFHGGKISRQHFSAPFPSKPQGGFENAAHSFVFDSSFVVSARNIRLGKHVTPLVIHHRGSEVLFHSICENEVDAFFVSVKFNSRSKNLIYRK